MKNNGNADFYEDGEVLSTMGYDGEAYQSMVKSTV